MKKIITFFAVLIFSTVAFAQSSAHRKMESTISRNASSAQASGATAATNAANNLPGTPTKIGNAIGSVQQGSAAIKQSVGNSNSINSGNGGRTVCRTVGTTIYYCN